MTFGEKVKVARSAQKLSQVELAKKIGVSDRAVYAYEKQGAMPKPHVLGKIAEVLDVSVRYLIDDDETDKHAHIEQELFLANAKKGYGYKGAREAREVVSQAAALFAGGELDDEAKDIFFRSLMEVYLESKDEARQKFSPVRAKSPKRDKSS